MLSAEELKANRSLVNEIDWSMTPEKAIEMYLEWGTGWIRGHDFVSSQDQESIYFVLYDWEENPTVVTLVRRTVEGAEDIAKVEVPADLFHEASREDGYRPGVGVHALNQPLKEWVCESLGSWAL
ncbi:MAG: hypothetical protein KKG47_02890 [Proteobacteria bacterium]|nr:hypothetical protein [Pseudomonadota bacterium]MBU1737931.1 hypothetical protein [Pseudomonadota bacterium]